jgi:glycosyltransferase involved in cell wall biosynthesis
MLVGLSLLTLVPGISGGSETYARELARSLARVGAHEYEALVPTLAPDAGGGLRTTVATEYPASTTIPGRLRAMATTRLHPGALRRRLEEADVVHYPLTVPVPSVRRPTVLTLLDTQHLDLPELFPRGERLFRRLAYDRTARRAGQVVVISDWVKARVVERLGIDHERVHAVHLGVDHARFLPAPDLGREPFLLYPARPWPHKNHERLFEAFSLVRRERPELRLVLTGVGHDAARLPDGVESHGSVSTDELVGLYRRAAALVFPSLYEGFGLPPLEAMACGCPVAVSDAGSLPEVVGDAAVRFDPTDPVAIAAGVAEALRRSAELSALGLTHAAGFTWDATARAHDRVYELAAGV